MKKGVNSAALPGGVAEGSGLLFQRLMMLEYFLHAIAYGIVGPTEIVVLTDQTEFGNRKVKVASFSTNFDRVVVDIPVSLAWRLP